MWLAAYELSCCVNLTVHLWGEFLLYAVFIIFLGLMRLPRTLSFLTGGDSWESQHSVWNHSFNPLLLVVLSSSTVPEDDSDTYVLPSPETKATVDP